MCQYQNKSLTYGIWASRSGKALPSPHLKKIQDLKAGHLVKGETDDIATPSFLITTMDNSDWVAYLNLPRPWQMDSLIITNYFIQFLCPCSFPFQGFMENLGDAGGSGDCWNLGVHKQIMLSLWKDVIWCMEDWTAVLRMFIFIPSDEPEIEFMTFRSWTISIGRFCFWEQQISHLKIDTQACSFPSWSYCHHKGSDHSRKVL